MFDLTKWQRIVLKVGSTLIAPDGKGCSSRYLLAIAHFVVRCRAMGIQVVLVSSGSVAAGKHLFSDNLSDKRDVSVTLKKAMAAAGQSEMMAAWDRLFDFPTAQLLLTQDVLQDHASYTSVRKTVFELLDHDILPVINENDAVSTDNMKVGDNDNLSAMAAAAVDADCLIICSDVDGLYDKNPSEYSDANLIDQVESIDSNIMSMAGGSVSGLGTGGMLTKLEAAQKATAHGILTFILNGLKESSFNKLLQGRNPGTCFMPAETPMQAKVHWLTHTSQARGEVIVNNNIQAKLQDADLKLDYSDIVDVNGDFAAGDTVLVRDEAGKKIAKATSRTSSCLLYFLTSDDVDDSIIASAQISGPVIVKNELAVLETK